MRLARLALALSCVLLATAAQAQPSADVPLTAQPQWSHRANVNDVVFDQTDGDRRAATLDIVGNCAVIDMATGTVLAARRLMRIYEAHVPHLELVGDEVRVVFSDGEFELVRWRWTDDVLESRTVEAPPGEDYLVGAAPNPANFAETATVSESMLRVVRADGSAVRAELTEAAREVHWVTESMLVLRYENRVEVRDARRPRRVMHRYDGRSMAIGWGKLAVAHYTQVSVLDFASGQESVLPHGRDQVSVAVVVGEDAAAVVFADGSTFVPIDGSRFRSIPGQVRWVGPRSALVVEGETVYRVSRANGSRRRAGTAEESMYAGGVPVWTGFHGAFGVLSDNMDDATLYRPNGHRTTPRTGGPHSVWHSDVLADGRVVLSGRFGTQIWSGGGVEDMSSCKGEVLLGSHEDAILTETGQCTPSRVVPWPGDSQAVARSGNSVLLDSSRVLDLASGEQTALAGLDSRSCDEEMGGCSWDARFVGGLVAVQRNWTSAGDSQGARVYTSAGRRLATVPEGSRIALAASGGRFAVHHLRGGRVLNARGEVLFQFGERNGAAAVSDAVFREDGRTLAWLADRETIEMLGPDGRSIWRAPVPVGARVHEVIGRRVRITSPEGAFMVSSQGRTPLPANISRSVAECAQGHLMFLDASGEVARGPECLQGTADVHGETLVMRSNGASTIYRGGEALTVGTIRGARQVNHFAYAPRGAWWVSRAGTLAWRRGRQVAEAPVPMSRSLEALFPSARPSSG